MANKRKLKNKKRLDKLNELKVFRSNAKKNSESSASESFSGESVDGRHS